MICAFFKDRLLWLYYMERFSFIDFLKKNLQTGTGGQ